MKYFRFTNWEPVDIDKALTGRLPKAMAEYDAGNKKPFIEYMRECKNPELLQRGWYRLGGWQFSIKEYCRMYWVQIKHYGIIAAYAPDKTTIRNTYGKHNVIKIVEV